MIYNFIIFFPRFCTHLGTSLSFIPLKPIEKTKKISKAKQQQDITPNRILKRDLIKNLDGFLKTIEKIVKKKRRLANAFKQKLNIDKQNSKIVVITILGNLNKEKLSISSLAPTFGKDVKNVAIIDANAFCLVC